MQIFIKGHANIYIQNYQPVCTSTISIYLLAMDPRQHICQPLLSWCTLKFQDHQLRESDIGRDVQHESKIYKNVNVVYALNGQSPSLYHQSAGFLFPSEWTRSSSYLMKCFCQKYVWDQRTHQVESFFVHLTISVWSLDLCLGFETVQGQNHFQQSTFHGYQRLQLASLIHLIFP